MWLSFPFYRGGRWGTETISDLLESPELAGGRAEILFQTVCLPNLCSSHLRASGTTSLVRIGISKLLSGRGDLYLDLSLVGSRTFSLNVNVAEAVGISPTHLSGLWILPPLCLHLLMTWEHLLNLRSLSAHVQMVSVLGVSNPGSASTMLDRLVYKCPPSSPL